MKAGLRNALQESIGISEYQLNRLILRSPYSYKIYTIPKKSGGERTIAQPAIETKVIQHWLIKNLFEKLPIHPSATAYKDGASIKKNAEAHKNNDYFVKLDFKDFFTSIKSTDLIKHFSKYNCENLSVEDIESIVRIACIRLRGSRELCLSIGAPSSPILSNTIMFEFDNEVSRWCTEHNVTYTRYADDLAFSTSQRGISNDIETAIREITQRIEYPKLSINEKKTTHLSKKHQRRITGIIINNQGRISLGRERKREISSLIHKYIHKQLLDDEIYRLQGLLGFAKDVEPLFLGSMRAKYSSKLIEEILQRRKK